MVRVDKIQRECSALACVCVAGRSGVQYGGLPWTARFVLLGVPSMGPTGMLCARRIPFPACPSRHSSAAAHG